MEEVLERVIRVDDDFDVIIGNESEERITRVGIGAILTTGGTIFAIVYVEGWTEGGVI